MRTVSIVCFALAVSHVAQGQPIEWPESEGGNGHHYELVLETRGNSWFAAYLHAAFSSHAGIRGHLVTITSPEEESWLRENLIEPRMPTYSVIYLGGWNDGALRPQSDCRDYGDVPLCGFLRDWHWVTGEEWSYQPWAPHQPSSHADGFTKEFALSYLYEWEVSIWPGVTLTGFNNLVFRYWETSRPVAHIIEYDDLAIQFEPPIDGNVPSRQVSWGSVKALYR